LRLFGVAVVPPQRFAAHLVRGYGRHFIRFSVLMKEVVPGPKSAIGFEWTILFWP